VLYMVYRMLGEHLSTLHEVDDVHPERAFVFVCDDNEVRVKSFDGLMNASRFISGDPHTKLSLLYHD